MEITKTPKYLYYSEYLIDFLREQMAPLGGTLFKISLMCLLGPVRYFQFTGV